MNTYMHRHRREHRREHKQRRDGRDAAERIHTYLTTKALAAQRIAAE